MVFLGFYTVNFLCFRENRANIQGVSTDKVTRKYVLKFWRNSQSSFFCAYYINVAIKFDDFFVTARERKSQLSKQFTAWKARNMRFLITQKPDFFLTLARSRHSYLFLAGQKKLCRTCRATLSAFCLIRQSHNLSQ